MAEAIQHGECIEKIMNAFAQIGHELTNKQAEQFFQYYEMLVETNKVMNLTAITEFDEVLQKHFVDSVLKSGHLGFIVIHGFVVREVPYLYLDEKKIFREGRC